MIRFADIQDLPRLVEIYNQAILAGNATGDTLPFTEETRWEWFNRHSNDHFPIYVYEAEDNQVAGYLSFSPYRDRPAFRRTAEISYYVDYSFHQRGIGSALMEHALADCPRLGFKVVIAILLEWNEPSQRLLRKFGFRQWGYMPEAAELSGRLCAHVYFGRRIS